MNTTQNPEPLKLSTSRKVSPWADPKKGSKVKNCFSLPAGRNGSCPGATDLCDPAAGGYCYAGRDEKRFPSVNALVTRNLKLLKAAGTVAGMVTLLDAAVTEFVTFATKRDLPLVFRIHEDGDFFSRDYAKAWAEVITRHPDVQFWAYTRSWAGKVVVTDILAGIDNLALYVSVDAANIDQARPLVAGWQAAGILPAIASEAEGIQDVSVSLQGRRAPVCPEIAGKLPLVNEDGVGACVACGMCIDGKAPVNFPIHR